MKKIRTIKCGRCKRYWQVDMNENKDLKCPYCGKKYKVDNLNEYYEAIDKKQ